MTEEKRRLSFGGGLLIYITVMLTLIFCALAVWWHFLSCFEAGRYEAVMDAYMTDVLEQELGGKLFEHCSGIYLIIFSPPTQGIIIILDGDYTPLECLLILSIQSFLITF